jgi:tol-pal system protein YbgF
MRIKALLVLGILVGLTGCALNQDVKNLERRMSQLEIENKALGDKIRQLRTDLESQAALENGLRDMYANQGAEFYAFKEDVRQLNGRFDEMEYRINKEMRNVAASIENTADTVGHFSKTAAENKDRISRVEHYVGYEPGGESKAEGEKAASDPAKMSEDELYKVSKQAYDRADYDTARQGFAKFLEIYSGSDKADNARFWIGEIYFAEKWFQKAILEYQEVIEKFPDGNKVAAAYLKQGLAFHEIGEDANALLVFKTLINKFPDSTEAGIAKQKIAQLE